MKLEVGLKFKEYYGEGNINNMPCHEVRGIVDDFIIVLFSMTPKGKQFYTTIDKVKFDYWVKKGHYSPLDADFTLDNKN